MTHVDAPVNDNILGAADHPAIVSTSGHAVQLHNIQVFISVAQSGSIAKAAQQLYKAPSAVSRSVLQLEEALNHPLFDREPRGMRLNELGKVVLLRALRIQTEIHLAAEELARSLGRPLAGSKSSIANYLFSERKLQLIVALSTTGSFKRTAQQLDIKPAGASMALARIEDVVGQPLFEKKALGIVATDAAINLVMRGKRVFAELRHLPSDISALQGELRGTVVLGTLSLGRSYLVPKAIAKVLSIHPGLRITSVESQGAQLIQGLRTGDIDVFVGILRDSTQSHEIAHERLFKDELCILVRNGHPLTMRNEITLRDLLKWQWILPDSTTLARKVTESAFLARNLQPPVPSLESSDSAMIREVLRAGDMLAVAGCNQMAFEIGSGALFRLPLRLEGTEREISLLTREGAMPSPAAKAVLDALRHTAQGVFGG